jgi:hypothetical protein
MNGNLSTFFNGPSFQQANSSEFRNRDIFDLTEEGAAGDPQSFAGPGQFPLPGFKRARPPRPRRNWGVKK